MITRWIAATALIIFAAIAAGCTSAEVEQDGQQQQDGQPASDEQVEKQLEDIDLDDGAKDTLRKIRDLAKEAVSDLEDLNDRAEDDDDINNRDPIFEPLTGWIENGEAIVEFANNPTTCLNTELNVNLMVDRGSRRQEQIARAFSSVTYPVYVTSNIRGVTEIWSDISSAVSVLRGSESCKEEEIVIAAAREKAEAEAAAARAKAEYDAAREEALREFEQYKTLPIIDNYTFKLAAGSWFCNFEADIKGESAAGVDANWAMLIGGLENVEVIEMDRFRSVGSSGPWPAIKYTITDIPHALYGQTDYTGSLRFDATSRMMAFTLEEPKEVVVSLRSKKTAHTWEWKPKHGESDSEDGDAYTLDCREGTIEEGDVRIINR